MESAQSRNQSSVRWPLPLIVVLCLAIFVLDLNLPLGVAGGVPYVAVVLLSLWTTSARLTLGVAVATSALTVLGYFLSAPASATWIVFTNRFLALFVIWTTAFLSLKRIESGVQIRAMLEADVKQLSGLLPMCASCKTIRDDEGYWQQIDSYITNHTQAQISHSVCPRCAKQLYPEHYRAMFPELGEEDFAEREDGAEPASRPGR